MAAKVETITATAAARPEKEVHSKINVILFSGGSGTQSITEALVRHPQIDLRILINAYDDGHSTGRLRRFIPGMLGPSDVRKNINRLMPTQERGQKSLKLISDYRLPVGISRKDALDVLNRIMTRDYALLPDKLVGAFPQLSIWQSRGLESFVKTFCNYLYEQEKTGRTFDFTDCALGNILFAGCYLEQGKDFNRTIKAFSTFYEVPPDMLLNITMGENLFLVAEKENGVVMRNEADIVADQDTAKIRELFLLEETTYLERVEKGTEPEGGWGALIRAANRTPRMNPEAADALASADVIVYGPGTQHSSLFPSYMTEGVAEAIAANSKADKVFLGNIHRDFDIQGDDASDLARKLLGAMNRNGQAHVEWSSVVSHFFVQGVDENTVSQGKYVPFDKANFAFPLETVKVGDWEGLEGRHSGGYVLDELRRIVQTRIDIKLEQLHHMVSIVIPVLNEEATIEQVLKAVTALDFQSQRLTKEVIVVDGGSTDHTVEKARSVRNVKVFTVTGKRGRGAAMRLGVEKSRGNIIVFFPGDAEYSTKDIPPMVASLMSSNFRAVIGTRAVKCTNLSRSLKQVYNNNWPLYMTSKYGGMLLSITTLLLYNRYFSDVLSSFKGYDAQLLRSLALKSSGLDLETEIVAKLSQRQEYVMEVPVDFTARTRQQGKKTGALDGLKALKALFLYRIRG
jgi:2-phospho-L-lactate transferase/gluconeogenesis factor (CofD/UPF0052 family)